MATLDQRCNLLRVFFALTLVLIGQQLIDGSLHRQSRIAGLLKLLRLLLERLVNPVELQTCLLYSLAAFDSFVERYHKLPVLYLRMPCFERFPDFFLRGAQDVVEVHQSDKYSIRSSRLSLLWSL